MRLVEKPWGNEMIWAETEKYIGKILNVRAGQMLSLQYHENKDESLYVRTGKIDVLIQDEHGNMITHTIQQYRGIRIPPKTIHRIIAVIDSEILEVSTAHPDDVVRLEDQYGRV